MADAPRSLLPHPNGWLWAVQLGEDPSASLARLPCLRDPHFYVSTPNCNGESSVSGYSGKCAQGSKLQRKLGPKPSKDCPVVFMAGTRQSSHQQPINTARTPCVSSQVIACCLYRGRCPEAGGFNPTFFVTPCPLFFRGEHPPIFPTTGENPGRSFCTIFLCCSLVLGVRRGAGGGEGNLRA